MQSRRTAFSAFTRPLFQPQTSCFTVLAFLLTCGALSAQSQESRSASNFSSTNPGAAANRAASSLAVPNLVKFSGTAKDGDSKPLNGVVGITFALYSNEQGGAALCQNASCQPKSDTRCDVPHPPVPASGPFVPYLARIHP